MSTWFATVECSGVKLCGVLQYKLEKYTPHHTQNISSIEPLLNYLSPHSFLWKHSSHNEENLIELVADIIYKMERENYFQMILLVQDQTRDFFRSSYNQVLSERREQIEFHF